VRAVVEGSPIRLAARFQSATGGPDPVGAGQAGAALARYGAPFDDAPSTVLPVGESTWNVGFAFPTEAAAAETLRHLVIQVVDGAFWGDPRLPYGTLPIFEVVASDGILYVGELETSPAAPNSEAPPR